MDLTLYLNFNGDCEAALKFYAQLLGGKIEMMQTHGDSPMAEQTPPEWRDRILHARLVIGNKTLMASDSPPQYYQQPQGYSISLSVDSPEEAERIFAAFAEGGSVRMPLQKTFWAARFGMVVDRFGTPWMVNYEQVA